MAYAAVAEVRNWLNITDNGLDPIITTALTAAEESVNDYCHRNFNLDSTTSVRYFDAASDGVVYTDDIGDSATVAVATDEAQDGGYATSWAAGDFQLLPLSRNYRVRPVYQIASTGFRTFPVPEIRRGLVRVTAKWGWPSVPGAVKQATIMQAARIVKRRSSPEGVAGFNDFGVVRITPGDTDLVRLLNPYVDELSFA